MIKRSAVWKHLEDFPPAFVRCMGRTGRGQGARGLTADEVAAASGLSLKRIQQIEQQPDWRGVDILEIEAFCRGCRFDPTCSNDRRDKADTYFRLCAKRNREPWWYLRNSPHWPLYEKLIQNLKSSVKSSAK